VKGTRRERNGGGNDVSVLRATVCFVGLPVNCPNMVQAQSVVSRALLGGDSGKRGPALLDVLAAAVRTRDLFLLMPSNGQSLQKGFLAVTAEEFVVGHTHLHSAEG